MKPKRDSARYLPLRSTVQPSQRHKRMLERARGWVHSRSRSTPILASDHFRVGRRKRKKVWMYPRRMSRYLGCTRRHLYWLIRNRRFPYHLTGSSASPRYIFKVGEVNRWLSGYRGKGRQLGLRRFRFGKNPRALALNQKCIWKHP
jgi:hypothetical protein